MAVSAWRPEGLPTVANCLPCRWDPPVEDVPHGVLMSQPDELSNYQGWHMQFAIEVYALDGEMIEQRVFERDYPYLIFGRDPANVHVFCGHDSISGQHAVFFFAWDANRSQIMCYLHNLESTHGVRIDNNFMPAAGCDLVTPEMEIEFGRAPVIFKFKYTEILEC